MLIRTYMKIVIIAPKIVNNGRGRKLVLSTYKSHVSKSKYLKYIYIYIYIYIYRHTRISKKIFLTI